MRYLTSFAVDFRYPGGDVTGKADAEEIMAITEALRASVCAILPPEVIGEQKIDAFTEGSDTTMAK
uniref:Uncharacterized protein n=1 Tax=Candidatus Kentrum sp. LPFa TaxID=2126335 RepID=A0A450WFJ2_9GAMM|nr:MAG: hypothetical protein BECKLPF1236A_GA0070988_1013312 [Candidatus Kentron sp. LPFa]VFK31530.1 MAG: hypothetical protein BECKLPF1236C_GA0070990_1014112 [Candidatus Kentron sp. LPFa]